MQVACGGCHMMVLAHHRSIQNGDTIDGVPKLSIEGYQTPLDNSLDLSGSLSARDRRRQTTVSFSWLFLVFLWHYKLFCTSVHIFRCNNAYACGFQCIYINMYAYRHSIFMYMPVWTIVTDWVCMDIGSVYVCMHVCTWKCVCVCSSSSCSSIKRIARQVREVGRF